MGPLPDGGTRTGARFQEDELLAAFDEVGGGGQADGAGTEDGDGVVGHRVAPVIWVTARRWAGARGTVHR